MKKIKVLHFTLANTGGGVTQFMLNLWKHIDKERFHFDFVTMSPYLDYAEELEKTGSRIYYVKTYAETDREGFEREISAILDNGYDVVHLHTSWWRGFALEEIAKKKGVPQIIIHSHNSDVHIGENQSREEARKLHKEQRELLNADMATDFLTCSVKAADWLYGDRIEKEKIRLIPNGVDTDEFAFNPVVREKYRCEMGLENNFVIGHVGRFAYQKNHEFLIDVFAEVVKQRSDARLLLVGTGALEEQIKEKVQKLGISEQVIFVGKRNDVNCLMQAMDLFVLPSRFEGLGSVLIEAQASGLKCIVSSEVPLEAKIIDDFEYISLERQTWVEKILGSVKNDMRQSYNELIRKEGFDIGSQVEIMERIYKSKSC